MKRCRSCGTELTEANKVPRRLSCRPCFNAKIRAYYQDNPDKYMHHKGLVRENDKRLKRQPRRHGITEEAFAVMVARFDGRCWVCKSREATVIDHNHECCDRAYSCGKCVRGVLCMSCNAGIGAIGEANLGSAIEYLSAPIPSVL